MPSRGLGPLGISLDCNIMIRSDDEFLVPKPSADPFIMSDFLFFCASLALS